jgi:hypothetical protein
VPRPPEQEALDEIATEEDGYQGYLELSGLTRIRDHVYVAMSSGVIAQGSPEWVHLEEVFREVRGGRVYRHGLILRVAGVPGLAEAGERVGEGSDFILLSCNLGIISIFILVS